MNLKASFEDKTQNGAKALCVLLELAEDSLQSKLDKHFNLQKLIDTKQVAKWLHHIALGMAFLHEENRKLGKVQRIIHRDLKPGNILICAKNVAKIAKKKGIPTMNEFFGEKTAIELSESKKKADILIGNNVLAHVPNLNDFIKGLKILLNSGGVITLEFPHILQLIQYNQFDTIYHEHFSYFSFITIQKILAFHKLNIFDVEELSTHGGSLRIFVCHDDDEFLISNNVELLIQKEQKFGLDKIETYVNFQQNINHLKNSLHKFFVSTKKENKTVVGFGAPAKGNTLLNFCKIGTNFLDYVVDNNPHKQGLFLPGTHIPIFSPQKIYETKPDYLIILPWNLKNEIIEQTNFIKEWGGKHVLLIPEIEIIK